MDISFEARDLAFKKLAHRESPERFRALIEFGANLDDDDFEVWDSALMAGNLRTLRLMAGVSDPHCDDCGTSVRDSLIGCQHGYEAYRPDLCLCKDCSDVRRGKAEACAADFDPSDYPCFNEA